MNSNLVVLFCSNGVFFWEKSTRIHSDTNRAITNTSTHTRTAPQIRWNSCPTKKHRTPQTSTEMGSTLQLQPMRLKSMDLTLSSTTPRFGPCMLSPNASSSYGSFFTAEFLLRLGLPLVNGLMTLHASSASRLRKRRRIFARTVISPLLFGTT